MTWGEVIEAVRSSRDVVTITFSGPWRKILAEEASARGVSQTEFLRQAIEALVPGAHERAVAIGWKGTQGKSHPRSDRNPYTVRPVGRPKKVPPEGRRDKPGRLGKKP